MKRKIGFTFKTIPKKERIFLDPPKAVCPANISNLAYRPLVFQKLPITAKDIKDTKNVKVKLKELIIRPVVLTNDDRKRIENLTSMMSPEYFAAIIKQAYNLNMRQVFNAAKYDLENHLKNIEIAAAIYTSIHKLNEERYESSKQISGLAMKIGFGSDHSDTIAQKDKWEKLTDKIERYKQYESVLIEQHGKGTQITQAINDRINECFSQVYDLKYFYREIFSTFHKNSNSNNSNNSNNNHKNPSYNMPSEFDKNAKDEQEKLVTFIISAEIKEVMEKFVINN